MKELFAGRGTSTGSRTGLMPMAGTILTMTMAVSSNNLAYKDIKMYNKLCSYENLAHAFQKAKKGKTKRRYIKRFEKKLEENLLKLKIELETKTYNPKPLKDFILRDPKTRKISKSAFRDRVVHHALINVIGRMFEKGFIYDSHANQIGKGTLKAVQRFDKFKRKVSRNNTRTCYILKADIRHYFSEVDHKILLSILQTKIKDPEIMWLIEQILQNSSGGRRDFY